MRQWINMKMIKKKAQHLAELSLLIAVVFTAFTGMQIFVKRSLQAKAKSSIDSGITLAQKVIPAMQMPLEFPRSEEEDAVILKQYEPYYQDEETVMDSESMQVEENFGIEKGAAGNARFVSETYSKSGLEQQAIKSFDKRSDVVW